jgi:lysozyme
MVNADKRLSSGGERFIAGFEGVVLHPYNDPWNATIGIGHLIHLGTVTQADLDRYRHFTYADALALLAVDVHGVEATLRRTIYVALNRNQWDALVSLVFNCGPGVLADRVGELVNHGQFAAAAEAWQAWCHGNGGVVLPGLVRRRQAERDLFLTPEAEKTPPHHYQPADEARWIAEDDLLTAILQKHPRSTTAPAAHARLVWLRVVMRRRMRLIVKLAHRTGWDTYDRAWRLGELQRRVGPVRTT